MTIVPGSKNQLRESSSLIGISVLKVHVNRRLTQTGFEDTSKITGPLKRLSERDSKLQDPSFFRKALLTFEFGCFWMTDPSNKEFDEDRAEFLTQLLETFLIKTQTVKDKNKIPAMVDFVSQYDDLRSREDKIGHQMAMEELGQQEFNSQIRNSFEKFYNARVNLKQDREDFFKVLETAREFEEGLTTSQKGKYLSEIQRLEGRYPSLLTFCGYSGASSFIQLGSLELSELPVPEKISDQIKKQYSLLKKVNQEGDLKLTNGLNELSSVFEQLVDALTRLGKYFNFLDQDEEAVDPLVIYEMEF